MIELGNSLAWIRRVLGEVPQGKSESAPRSPASRASRTRLCEICSGRVAEGVPRCPLCGNQVARPQACEPTVPDDRALSEIQKRILISAVKAPGGSYVIHVMPNSERIEGEIKAGDQRLYGSEAIEAVEGLCRAGYVEREQGQMMKLTDQGQRMASALWS